MADEVSRIVGGTPLVRLDALSGEIGAEVFVKYEAGNPGGSIKDRAARSMVDRAEERGDITPGKTLIVEPTSGNTGVALAMIGAARGYEVVLTMPESMSRERRMLLAAYGARLVLTPAAEGMAGSVAEAERIAREGIDPELWERAAGSLPRLRDRRGGDGRHHLRHGAPPAQSRRADALLRGRAGGEPHHRADARGRADHAVVAWHPGNRRQLRARRP